MDLSTFIADMQRRHELAQAVSSSPEYLYQLATGRRRASVALARRIAAASEAIGPEPVTLSDLRPDVWPPATTDQENRDVA